MSEVEGRRVLEEGESMHTVAEGKQKRVREKHKAGVGEYFASR